jgi:hypothetical protein
MAILSANLLLPNPSYDTVINTVAITGAGLHFMQYAPDGESLILNILHRSRFYSTLSLSAQPVFTQKAVSLPVYTIRTLPYFPNFRLFDWPGSVCDTLGVNAPVSVTNLDQKRLITFPNPATDVIYTQLDSPVESLQLFDALGREIPSGQFTVSDGLLSLPINQLSAGLYYISLQIKGWKWTGRFVKG